MFVSFKFDIVRLVLVVEHELVDDWNFRCESGGVRIIGATF